MPDLNAMHVREELDTNSMNNMSKSVRYKHNHFHCLPEEIMVSIFNKVADIKYLCHCSLVSKQFATTVIRVQTVSVTIPGRVTSEKKSLEYMKKFTKLVSELDDYNAEQVHGLLDSLSLQHMKLPIFLDKLRELTCVYLNYDYAGQSSEAKFPVRKIKFCPNGTMFESFVALESLSIDRDTENEAGVEEDFEHIFPVINRVADSCGQFLLRFLEWNFFMTVLLISHYSLRRVTIDDSEVHGKLDIGDEEGDDLDIDVLVDLMESFSGCIYKYGWAPMLRLPSGSVMRGVALAIVYHPENSFARANKLEEIEFCDFDDELPVFREGVKEFLKKHKDELIILDGGELP